MADGQMAGTGGAGATSGEPGTGGAAGASGADGTEEARQPSERPRPQGELEQPERTGPAHTPTAAPAAATPAPTLGRTETEAPRPPARPLDAVDRGILRILRADGRASIRSVAERVHISRANAYARINRLLDDGVIRGFSARIDQERAGQGASAYITLKIVQNSWRRVREQLLELPGAAHMALVGGDFDVLLLVHTQDNRALRDLVLTRIQSIPEVISTRTVLVFEETDLEPEP